MDKFKICPICKNTFKAFKIAQCCCSKKCWSKLYRSTQIYKLKILDDRKLNRSKISEYQKEYRAKNSNRLKELRKIYYKNHKNEAYNQCKKFKRDNPISIKKSAYKWRKNNPEYINNYKNNGRTNCHDWYIRRLLSENSNIKANEIPESLVEVKRIHLKLKRLIKKMSN